MPEEEVQKIEATIDAVKSALKSGMDVNLVHDGGCLMFFDDIGVSDYPEICGDENIAYALAYALVDPDNGGDIEISGA